MRHNSVIGNNGNDHTAVEFIRPVTALWNTVTSALLGHAPATGTFEFTRTVALDFRYISQTASSQINKQKTMCTL